MLQDGELTLTQSNAILGYLAAETPWAGTTRADRALAQAWMCFEQERVMPGIGGVRFRLVTGRATLTELAAQLQTGREALVTLEQHLAGRDWLVGPSPTIADLSVWAYSHLAPEVGLTPGPAFIAWSQRLNALQGFVNDLAAYDANARPGAGQSTYG